MNKQSKKPNKTYAAEFKGSAVKLAIETDQPISQTARELDVNVNTLHTWISKYSKPVKEASNRSDEHIYDEVKRLILWVSTIFFTIFFLYSFSDKSFEIVAIFLTRSF